MRGMGHVRRTWRTGTNPLRIYELLSWDLKDRISDCKQKRRKALEVLVDPDSPQLARLRAEMVVQEETTTIAQLKGQRAQLRVEYLAKRDHFQPSVEVLQLPGGGWL